MKWSFSRFGKFAAHAPRTDAALELSGTIRQVPIRGLALADDQPSGVQVVLSPPQETNLRKTHPGISASVTIGDRARDRLLRHSASSFVSSSAANALPTSSTARGNLTPRCRIVVFGRYAPSKRASSMPSGTTLRRTPYIHEQRMR